MSVPSSAPVNPAASAAAAPPDDPPGTCAADHGLVVVPNTSLRVWASPHQRGRFVLPKTTAPALFNCATAGASAEGTWSAGSAGAPVDRMPSVSIASLIGDGRAWRQ